ncbi:hypothetical protein BDW22DRAFT_1349559, partial [Trametopsis cervina]
MTLRMLYRNREKYQKILETVVDKDNLHPEQRNQQLNLFALPERLRISTAVYVGGSNGPRMLVHPFDSAEDTEREEVVVNLQGYILRCTLPPITRPEQLPKNVMAAKQSVILTGLGSELFDAAGRAVMEIHTYLASTLPDGCLQP